MLDGGTSVEKIAYDMQLDIDSVQSFVHQLIDKKLVDFDGLESNNSGTNKVLNLWIHTTNKCNLGCNYCYIGTLQTTGGMNLEVRQKLIVKLIETADRRSLSAINLKIAGGEPMIQFNIWKDFIKDVQTAFTQKKCKVTFSVLTNLTFIDQEVIDFAKLNNIVFGVTLDGLERYHDLARHFHNKRGTFELVNANIDKLILNGVKCSVSTVITEENMEGIPALTDFLIKKNIFFRYSVIRGGAINRIKLAEYLHQSYDLMEIAVSKGWSFSKFHKLNDLKPFQLGNQTCSAGHTGGAIYVDGSVYYCHVQFGTGIGKNGSIFDPAVDVLDLIESGAYNEGYRSEDCLECNYRYSCTSGCPIYRVGGKDVNCGLYYEFLPRLYTLQAQERLFMINKVRRNLKSVIS